MIRKKKTRLRKKRKDPKSRPAERDPKDRILSSKKINPYTYAEKGS